MNFCPHCGSPNLTHRIPEGDTHPRQICTTCATIHYSNPKIVTGCLPVWQDKVLLCRRAIAPAYGLWNVPSGYLENGESVREGARREVWEEARAEVRLDYLITLYDIERIQQLYLQYVGDLVEGRYAVGEESLEVRLFTEQEIPWEDIAFTSSAFTLRNYFRDRKNGTKQLYQNSYPATAS